MNRETLKITESADERELIMKAAAGDRGAFNEIMEKHGKMVYNLCYKFLGNTDDAEDCAQEVFLKVFKNLGRFAFRSSLSTWLYRISINSCKNYRSSLQSRKKEKEMSLSGSFNDTEKTTEIGDRSFMPEDNTVRNEQYEHILSAIRKLPDDLKKVVMLRDVENRSYEEVAEITGFKIGTVKSRLSRARHHLREELRGML